jgi:hypothetical protein
MTSVTFIIGLLISVSSNAQTIGIGTAALEEIDNIR